MRKTLPLFALIWLTVCSASLGPLLRGNPERVAGLAYAQSPSFYQGKTIRIIVGSDSGGLMTSGLGYWPSICRSTLRAIRI
jgi:hypothetical protein